MKGRMRKISRKNDNWRGNNRRASECYPGVQTFIGITENNFTEVRFTENRLLEQILSPSNLNNNDNLRRANYPFLMDCYRKIVS